MYQTPSYQLTEDKRYNTYITPDPMQDDLPPVKAPPMQTPPAHTMPGAGPYDYDGMPAYTGDMPEALTNPIYTPAMLSQYIGKLMRVEFLIGNTTTERVGRLLSVGASYILLQALENGVTMLCDMYAIKFVTIMNNDVVAMDNGRYL